MTNASLNAALTYADRNWRVVPIPQGQKYPRFDEWQNVATTDEDLITIWWERWPDDGVGIACGIESGLFVIDVDVADGKVGARTLADLEAQFGELPETYTVRTPTGGLHLYFLQDPARPIRNGKLGLHVDIRGEGGQVLAPPSIHPDTGTPYVVENDTSPVVPPEWVFAILLGSQEAPAEATAAAGKERSPDEGDQGPAKEFNERHTWKELLETDGWTFHHQDEKGTLHWTRPGKDPKKGTSATTMYDGRDCLKVFTSSVPELEEGRAYSRFGYYAAMVHGGDRSAAAVQLLKDGYGPDLLDWIDKERTVDPVTGEISDEWPPLIPLGTQDTELPPFPVEVLPAWMAEMATDVAADLQVPIDLPATLGIAALSACTAGRVMVAWDDWHTATNLYLVVAMPPGAGKSPALKAMVGPLEDHEVDLAEAVAKEISEANSRLRKAKSALKRAEDKGDEVEMALRLAEVSSIEVPTSPRITIEDTTPEALVRILGEQQGRIALMSTEGGLFEVMTGRYGEKRSNLEPYLQAWSGDTIKVDRMGRDTIIVRDPYLTVGITVQPQALMALAERPELAGRGLTARFMYSVPESNVGSRNMRRRKKRADKAIRSAYSARIVELHKLLARYQVPGTLLLNDPAADLFGDWRQSIEERRGPGGDLEPLAEWTTKLEASVLRLAGILHLADGRAHSGDVSADVVADAITVGDYWIEHAFAVHDLWGTDPVLRDARVILDWIDDNEIQRFTARDVYGNSRLRRRFKKAEMTEAPLQLLAERGWIRGEIKTGQRGTSRVLEVNPAAAELRAMRAQAEIEREVQECVSAGQSVELRAMRAMPLVPNHVSHTHSEGLSAPEKKNGVGRAHGAHGAQPEPGDEAPAEPYAGPLPESEPSLDWI